MQQLDHYLRNPQPGYACLITGGWGVGKSFQWHIYARNLQDMKPITFSAAGLQTAEDLERALFQASVDEIAGTTVAEVGAVIGRALLRVAKVDPDDIKWKADLTRDKTVVCIDDIERFAGSFNVIFGFIVNLIDASGVHCVLIADESRALIKFDDYALFKERIVGKTLTVRPESAQFCEYIIKGFSRRQNRESLLAGLDALLGLIDQAKLENLRTVRFFLTELDLLCAELPTEVLPHVTSSHLPAAVLFWTRAVAKAAGSERVARQVFASDAVGISLALREIAKQKGHVRSEEKDELGDLLADLNLTNAASAWPMSQAFIDHMQGQQGVDYARLATDFGLLEHQRAYDPVEIIHHYERWSDQEVQEAIVAARAEFHNQDGLPLMRIHQLFRSLYFMSELGIFEVAPDDWTRGALDRLDELSSELDRIEVAAFEIWPAPYDENETQVVDKLQALNEDRNRVAERDRRKKALRTLLEGGAPDGDMSITPVFEDMPAPEEFLIELKALGSQAVSRFSGIFRRRMQISNARDFVSQDRDYAAALMEVIEEQVPMRRPMSVLDAELRRAMTTLRKFVEKMDGAVDR
ncbi:KAP family NTPase [Pseudoxanthomonas winnipegensis]|uniref:P-loop NTPase fold protein n=1 Tax=Pseudoxanthomonas winnipegensis TaxID=2480810 RepID=UPI002577A5E2|nr:P-loop NTPase fold protein [Pseudoxanthomonas winnipegensis]WJI14660.1 KAP family NTPase [Pseudoxanthomonas winnipegensis]